MQKSYCSPCVAGFVMFPCVCACGRADNLTFYAQKKWCWARAKTVAIMGTAREAYCVIEVASYPGLPSQLFFAAVEKSVPRLQKKAVREGLGTRL